MAPGSGSIPGFGVEPWVRGRTPGSGSIPARGLGSSGTTLRPAGGTREVSSTYAVREARAPARAGSGSPGERWFGLCALVLIVASDYEFRARDPLAAFDGSVDVAVLVEVALYGLVGIYLSVVHGRPPRLARAAPYRFLATCYVGLMALSVTYAPNPTYAAVRVGQMGVLLALCLTGARVARRAHLHWFAHAYVALIACSVLYGIVVPSAPVSSLQRGRFTWLAIHPTVSGVLMAVATVVVVAYLAAKPRAWPGPVWPVPVYMVALVLVAGGTIASRTRGAIIGALVGALVALFATTVGRLRAERQLAAVLVAVGVVLAAEEPILEYLRRGQNTAELLSFNARTDLWSAAAEAFSARPLFGFGVTASRVIFYETLRLGGGHNALVNVVVDLGIVGALVWVALVAGVVVGAVRLSTRADATLRVDRAVLVSVLAALLVDGIVFEGLGSVTNVAATWFFVCITWLSVASRAAGGPAAARLR